MTIDNIPTEHNVIMLHYNTIILLVDYNIYISTVYKIISFYIIIVNVSYTRAIKLVDQTEDLT